MLRLLALLTFLTGAAHAACTGPTGKGGTVIFNAVTKTMQYCNDTNWINAGPSNPAAAQTGCVSPTGIAGGVIFNGALGTVQFCNGSSWVNTACPTDRQPGGSGCTSPTGKPGTIAFETNSKELQFCDSTKWVAMGWPCGTSANISITQVFATNLYNGNDSIQTITNGINLSGSGGLVWLKQRSGTGLQHVWYDTVRGGTRALFSSLTNSEVTSGGTFTTTFNTNGFQTGTSGGNINGNNSANVAWTFRRAPKFFDIVTYTGDGVVGRTVSHSLGISPGLIIIKNRSADSNWPAYHRSTGTASQGYINLTYTFAATGLIRDPVNETSFAVASPSEINRAGDNYVAYLFAHDPNPNGLIQCGSYIGNGLNSGPTITLGWTPQWLIMKRRDNALNWYILDSARGISGTSDPILSANTSNAESFSSFANVLLPTSTGFQLLTSDADFNASGGNYIYCAIRAAN